MRTILVAALVLLLWALAVLVGLAQDKPALPVPPRPRVVALATLEVEPLNEVDLYTKHASIRTINLRTSEGERFSIVGQGELVEWLVAQQSKATVVISVVNP